MPTLTLAQDRAKVGPVAGAVITAAMVFMPAVEDLVAQMAALLLHFRKGQMVVARDIYQAVQLQVARAVVVVAATLR